MPTYEYACSSCANQWEEIQKISEPATTTCPKCGKDTAKRQISGGTFILKGGGWYADLYSSAKPAAKDGTNAKDAKDAKKEGSSGSASTSSTEGTKSDAGGAKESPKASAPAATSSSSGKD